MHTNTCHNAYFFSVFYFSFIYVQRNIVSMSVGKKAAAHLSSATSSKTLLKVTGLVLLAGLLFVGVSFGTIYQRTQGNITQNNINSLLENSYINDPHEGEAYNMLVFGSDTRDGEGNNIDGMQGTFDGMRSDTTMLVHIPADRSRLDIVSIPRDTLVDIPSCKVRQKDKDDPSKFSDTNTYETQPQHTLFNSSFAIGGKTGDVASAAACSIATFQNLTGIDIDGYVVIDFTTFMGIINALDGVAIYVHQDIDDKTVSLKLEKGCQILDADTALRYARVRKSITGGSDINRLNRQQDMVKAIYKDLRTRNILTNSTTLLKVLDQGTKSLSTSEGLGDLTTLSGLAMSLKNVDVDKINTLTMPWQLAADGNRVVPKESATDIWEAIKKDQPFSVDSQGNVTIGPSSSSTGTHTSAGDTKKDSSSDSSSSGISSSENSSANNSSQSSQTSTKDNSQNSSSASTQDLEEEAMKQCTRNTARK